MYTPAFVEIFLGWCVVVAWATWLRSRTPPGPPAVAVAAMPWVTGLAVLAGQVAAFLGMMQQTGGTPSLEATSLVRNASLGSAGIVLLALVTEAALTLSWYLGRREG